eukprot:c17413_g1_i1 orf=266-2647(-)
MDNVEAAANVLRSGDQIVPLDGMESSMNGICHNCVNDEEWGHGNDDESFSCDREMEAHTPTTVVRSFRATNRPAPSRSLSKAYMIKEYPKQKDYGAWETLVMAYQTLGVVYGDIGTSPLYVFSSIQYPLSTTQDFLGVLSLIFWTLTLVALVKYVLIVLRADDHGEGGTFALYSLLCRNINIKCSNGNHSRHLESDTHLHFYGTKRHSLINIKTVEFLEKSKVAQKALMVLVMLGTCMVIGDGVLTPAISVLSAIVGIKSQDPRLSQTAVVAISTVILIFLFCLQRFGTNRVSFLFSPIMVAWFVGTAVIGVYNIVTYYPGVFKALSPHYIFLYFARHGKDGWVMLGAVVLCITGAEAMFADLGHFNKQSIQIAFCGLVYPSLILTYAGEAAYLIKNPTHLNDAFYKSTPHSVFWLMFVISILAAIVASQALISATFSIVKQSMALGCFPRVKIIHTSKKAEGQIYSPEVNICLMVLCIAVVFGFQTGAEIGNAFGVAVIWVMLITTFLVTLVMILLWNLPLPLTLTFCCVFGLIEGVFLTSVLNKVPQGGWVPFAISALFLIIMLSWNHGRQKKYDYELRNKISKEELGRLLFDDSIARVPGMCLFYSDLVHGLPPIISHYVKCVGTLHRVLVFVTFRHIPVKTVLAEERFLVDRLPFKGVYRCVARFGYMDLMSLTHDQVLGEIIQSIKLHILEEMDLEIELEQARGNNMGGEIISVEGESEVRELEAASRNGAVYVLGKSTLHTTSKAGWFERFVINRLFQFLAKNCRSAMAFLNIPPSQFLQVGMTYEI